MAVLDSQLDSFKGRWMFDDEPHVFPGGRWLLVLYLGFACFADVMFNILSVLLLLSATSADINRSRTLYSRVSLLEVLRSCNCIAQTVILLFMPNAGPCNVGYLNKSSILQCLRGPMKVCFDLVCLGQLSSIVLSFHFMPVLIAILLAPAVRGCALDVSGLFAHRVFLLKALVSIGTMIGGALFLRCTLRVSKTSGDGTCAQDGACDDACATDSSPPCSIHTLSPVLSHPPLIVNEIPSDRFVARCADTADPLISQTATAVAKLALCTHGACAFAVSTKAAFCALQASGIDFLVVDNMDKWPKGYMTERLRGVPVQHPQFESAVQEFSAHTSNDRWPADHEASGLPKDGFTALLDPDGFRLSCAVRLIGLPNTPFYWNHVGMRHTTALALSWCLRSHPSIVFVRSETGKVTCLSSYGVRMPIAFCCGGRGVQPRIGV